MMYKKPDKVSYTAMAIYIDQHIRDDDCNEELCFEYMWHLFYILAVRGKFFLSARDYDEYAFYGATQLFLRYKKERDPNRRNNLKPIKSCLNYIKKVLYPFKVNYQKNNFEQVFQSEALNDEAPLEMQADAEHKAREAYRNLLSIEYVQYLEEICSTMRNFLKASPYYSDKSLRHNIYISCLLTLLKTMTISNKNRKRLKLRERSRPLSMLNLIDSVYEEESRDDVVVYHLDKSMSNYIATVVNGMKKEMAKDLRFIVGSFEPPDQIIKDILASPLENYIDKEGADN